MTFADNLVRLRREKGFSQEQLADLAMVPLGRTPCLRTTPSSVWAWPWLRTLFAAAWLS